MPPDIFDDPCDSSHRRIREASGRGRGGFGRGGWSRGSVGGSGGMPRGRKFSSADLQLVLLALLEKRPAHGYELIRALEEKSNSRTASMFRVRV